MVFARETFALLEYEIVALSDSLRFGMRSAARSLDLVNAVLSENREKFTATLDTTLTMVSNLSDLSRNAGSMIDSTGPRLARNLEQMEAVMAELQVLMEDMNRYSLWQMLFKVREHPDSTGTGRKVP